jgi:hypothetical protein
MRFTKNILNALLVLHFLIVSVHIVVKNTGYGNITEWTSNYIDPYFIQEWEMFAPPPQTNTKLFYRYLVHHQDGLTDTTDFQEILEPLYQKQKTEIYSLSRLSYYLFNCSQNLLTQCHEYILNLPDNIDPCDSIQIAETFHHKIQQSFSFQSITRHAKLIYQHNYDLHSEDVIYFSFHLLDEVIPDYETRDSHKSEPRQLTAYNSSFYPLNF